jgi:hypothetical protein
LHIGQFAWLSLSWQEIILKPLKILKMKKSILFMLSFFTLSTLFSQSYFLNDIIYDHNDDKKATVNYTDKGGSISFDKTYTSSCTRSYTFTWVFSKAISELKNGEEFSVVVKCEDCPSPEQTCKKWTRATVGGGNNILKLKGYDKIDYNSNIAVENTTAGSFGVNSWSSTNRSHTWTFKVNKKKEANYTVIYLRFGNSSKGHNVYYVFSESDDDPQLINCHTLLGLGKNLFSLEIGALNGYSIEEWMIPTINAALNHIEASNCLSPDYLIDLKKRMEGESDSSQFYDEIQSYSLSVETEVATACSCCSQCIQESR